MSNVNPIEGRQLQKAFFDHSKKHGANETAKLLSKYLLIIAQRSNVSGFSYSEEDMGNVKVTFNDKTTKNKKLG